MPSRLDLALDLLHTARDAALATHSSALPGFPFVSYLPFVADAHHSPVFLISRLAEHTQNLLRDERASLLLRQPGSGAEIARMTLVGAVRPIDAEPLLVARYLRYQPEAERFLELGDFGFFRLHPLRLRTIGGFAQAGWLEAERLLAAPSLPLADEAGWLKRLAGEVPAAVRLLGIDPFGLDVIRDDCRERHLFEPRPVVGEAIGPAVVRALRAIT